MSGGSGITVTDGVAVRWSALPWEPNDGGRAAAGFRGDTGDCVTRAVAIATGLPYREVYDAINAHAQLEKPRNGGKRSNARTGVFKHTTRRYLEALGWEFVPLMSIGSGCRYHLRTGELPENETIIAKLSKHVCCIVNGVVQDTHDPSRGGMRCVYGYYRKVAW